MTIKGVKIKKGDMVYVEKGQYSFEPCVVRIVEIFEDGPGLAYKSLFGKKGATKADIKRNGVSAASQGIWHYHVGMPKLVIRKLKKGDPYYYDYKITKLIE